MDRGCILCKSHSSGNKLGKWKYRARFTESDFCHAWGIIRQLDKDCIYMLNITNDAANHDHNQNRADS